MEESIPPRYVQISKNKVAIKVLNKVKINNNHIEIRSQIKKLKKLNHPNVVKYIESYENEYNIYLVMEYYTGGDLERMIQKKARNGINFTEKEARNIIKKSLTALKYCHSEGFVHGNLKPWDIMFDENKEVKIIDFLKIPPNLANSNTSGLHYMAPEMKKWGKATGKTDIWSLGVILHVMLTGRYPFSGDSYKLNEKLFGKMSEEVVQLMTGMLSINERFSADEWLSHSWVNLYLEEDSLKEEFLDSDFERETTPLKKPQSQPKGQNSVQMLFRLGSEKVKGTNEKFEVVEMDKLLPETEDTNSIQASNKLQENEEHEEMMQKIMEEIFDDDLAPVGSSFEE